ncbi:glycosyltransferase [Chromohalobacter japonicus]|uniref:glycosyltransferase n=1 Tax=Chromohalobacter japonicus TaxID=223900 RepID=UPI000693BA43|nr:glycosyltransferase [Chromohalobacter japonicus]
MIRIVLDLQTAQVEPESAEAGIVLALAKRLASARPGSAELTLVLNAALPGTIEPLRGEFHELLSQHQLRVWYPPEDMGPAEQGSTGMRSVAERLYQAFVAELGPDLVILPGLWRGWQDANVVSLESGPLAPAAAVLLPSEEELAETEFADPDRDAWQKQRLEQLRRASYLLEVPGLTVAPDDLEDLDGADRIRLPAGHEPETAALAEAAERLWELAESEHAAQAKRQVPKSGGDRPRLAYVSPLPPEQTGIGYYSAELLPELARYYDIDVVVDQGSVEDDWINAHCGIRSVAWFERHGHEYERVVYQFGNSRFHAHMWDLIEKVPGVAVVHDFYLGDAVAYREDGAGVGVGLALPRELYHSHGYAALKPLITEGNRPEAIRQFPCSYSPIREAKGVIVHSRHAQELAAEWYGEKLAEAFHVIPHLRELPDITHEHRRRARERLGIPQNAFLICSFGIVNKTKLSHRLFSAWQNAQLRHDPEARLVYVGDTPDEHGKCLRQEVEASEYGQRISFTGWAESGVFQDYLTAADVAVQLRTNSRGETSGTVLDCMAHGVATICNAHGSFAEVPNEGVWMLEDRFENDALVEALDALWQDSSRRRALGGEARSQIQQHYSPAFCGERYFQAIESAYLIPSRQRIEVVKRAVYSLPAPELNERLAACIGTTLPVRPPQKQLLVDVSVVAREDLRTGVQRVVRSILSQLMEAEQPGIRIEPVYTHRDMKGYFYAREFTQQFMGGRLTPLSDEPVEAHSGDIFLGLDLHSDGIQAQRSYLERLRDRGVKVVFVVHDLLPVTHPHWFPAAEEQTFENWLDCITRFDGAICVSQTTADELEKWMASRSVQRHRPYQLGVAHNGADIRQSVPSMGLPDDAEEVLAKLRSKPSFLMVGTVEPRKGVTQVLDAFELLWQQGYDFNLVLVGKRGWNIDELAERLEQHQENHRRLFWLRGISDEYLERVYADSTCLIAGSEGEGFGLPLIEAAQQGIPILARDIPVFKEVAGEYADYFTADGAEQLAMSVEEWFGRYQEQQNARSAGMTYLTWMDSAERYLDHLLG